MTNPEQETLGFLGPYSKINRSHKVSLILALIGITILCWFGYYLVFEMARYTTLSIPSPSAYISDRGDWSTTTHSKFDWRDKPNSHYFIWRREGHAYSKSKDPEFGYTSWEALVQYFDEWLNDEGWVLYDDLSFDPCRSYLPESNFLPRGENGYIIYRQDNTLRFAAEPTVCLAAWPLDPSVEPTGKYNVVLLTVTPSLFTEWESENSLVP